MARRLSDGSWSCLAKARGRAKRTTWSLARPSKNSYRTGIGVRIAASLLDLPHFRPEEGDDMWLRNVLLGTNAGAIGDEMRLASICLRKWPRIGECVVLRLFDILRCEAAMEADHGLSNPELLDRYRAAMPDDLYRSLVGHVCVRISELHKKAKLVL